MKNIKTGRTIKKRHIEAAVLFAINNIPHIDSTTLEKFVELVDVNGNFGSVSDQQIVQKMILLVKHVPSVCGYSLLTLAELLGICVPVQISYKLNIIISEELHRTWLST